MILQIDEPLTKVLLALYRFNSDYSVLSTKLRCQTIKNNTKLMFSSIMGFDALVSNIFRPKSQKVTGCEFWSFLREILSGKNGQIFPKNIDF